LTKYTLLSFTMPLLLILIIWFSNPITPFRICLPCFGAYATVKCFWLCIDSRKMTTVCFHYRKMPSFLCFSALPSTKYCGFSKLSEALSLRSSTEALKKIEPGESAHTSSRFAGLDCLCLFLSSFPSNCLCRSSESHGLTSSPLSFQGVGSYWGRL
jgi:hypothetical protein